VRGEHEHRVGRSSFNNGTNFAVRAPFEIGLEFHNAPIELYGEIALELTLIDATTTMTMSTSRVELAFGSTFELLAFRDGEDVHGTHLT
jgi:hypothetical protein